MKRFYISPKHMTIVLLMILGVYGHSLMAACPNADPLAAPQDNTLTFKNTGTGSMTITSIYFTGSPITIASGATNTLTCRGGGSPTEFFYSGGTAVQVTSAANGGTYYTAMLSGGFIIIPGEVLQENYWGTEAPTKTYTPSCSTPFTYKLGAGAYQDIVIPANTYVDFSWNSNAGSTFGGINGYKATVSGGTGNSGVDGAFQFNTTSGWYSGSTDATIRVLAKRTNGSWDCNRYATLTIATSQPIAPTLNTKTPDVTNICAGQNVSATINAGSGGASASDTYQYSIDGGTWTAYTSGATINTSSATTSVQIRVSRSAGTGSGCIAAGSTVIASWTVYPQIVAPTLNVKTPNVANICEGTNVSATINAGSGGIGASDTYQYSIDGGTWTAYTSGATINTSSATSSVQIRVSRSAGTGSGCNAAGPTVIASWTVVAQPTAPTLNVKTPNVANICAGQNVSATINAGSGGASASDTYQYSIDGGTWTAYTSGATINTSSATTSVQIRVSRSAGTGSGCNLTPTVIASWAVYPQIVAPTLNVKTPNVANICEGTNVSATINAGSGGIDASDTYQYSIDGGTWTAYTSGATINTSSATASVQIRVSRSAGTGSGCNAAGPTVIASWAVYPQIVAPTLNVKTPNVANICAGQNVSATINVGSGGIGASDTYQYSIDGGTWTAYTSGATINTSSATASVQIRVSRSAGTGSGCNAAGPTVIASWTVVAAPTAGSIGNAQTLCNGADPAAISSITDGTGSGTITYRWESSPNNSTWTAIAGEVLTTYDPPVLTSTMYYRRVTISTNGGNICESTSATTPIQITVQSVPTAGVIGNAQTICNNTTPVAISSTTAGTGSGTITYRWEQAEIPYTTWTTAIGTISGATFTPSALTANTQYRRFTISTLSGNVCESTSATTPIQITVQSVPTAGTISSSNIVICTGGNPAAFNNDASGTGDGTITYRWEKSVDPFITWTTIGSATGATYDPPAPLSQTTKFRRYTVSTVGANACESSSASNEITIYTDDNNSGGVIASTNSTRTCVIYDANWHYFRNDAGEVIAAVNSNGENLGSTTMTVTIEDNLHNYNSIDYDSPEHGDGGLGRSGSCFGLPELSMRRWYTITPSIQPTANCNVKLFFTNNDYSNYASEIGSWDTDHTGQNSYSFCYGSTSNNLDLVISKDESYDLLSVIGKSATGGPGGTTEYEFTVPSFSTFRFHTTSGIGGPLPVELLSFNGYFSNSSNVLEWVTLSEINSQKFVIEKSINATNWTAIGEVAAAGNSNQRLEYTFIDVNPEVGNNYYRLKIIDFDGTYSYSGVIDILVDGITENKIVNLYPNPTNRSTTITTTLSSVQNQTARIDIVDMLGRIMLSQNVELTSGYNNIKLDVNVLNGTYVLRYIDNNGKSHYGKFIKN
ncbi:MAG: T9SS type A sorting domain-containing protein [Sphingobacteriales bacterium]|nr:MAG: T9SS type A sorting domain-containing protein [Sphingobacteriales bacterium]